ncbi:uncharacterized protein L203_102895 [Cryptococcus depauperatus CBS 7841]|uniref:Uncharacterized protein n=1 Tax=Cryptococcus depauperatus CBS 7841 TaxID=1295531 RepID=A0A1E3IB34_9TREE|nr:hypothetical protein L203_04700 [Cryptococcus depauperatus CBS 7841]
MPDDTLDQQPSSSRLGVTELRASMSTEEKKRQNALWQHYTFPERGRNGGSPDPFEILGLDHNADQLQVKQQYYKLALLLHPDSSHPSSSPDHFAALNKAYNLLSKPSSRSIYLKTGYGWDLNSLSSVDAQMRAEIARRRNGGSAAWNNANRQYRDHEAGKGAWGNFDGSQGWKSFESSNNGFEPPTASSREERYMSNQRFLAVIGLTSAVVGWLHWNRLNWATDTHREMLNRKDIDASHALAQARHEAALHGHIRREKIRQRVREAELFRELEAAKQGHMSRSDENSV